MNPTFVFLGIAIAVIIYLIYIYWYDTSSKLSDYKSISSAELTISGISMPTTRRYAYGIWVFVNGKLVKTHVLQKMPQYSVTDTFSIGDNNGLKGSISNIKYHNEPLTKSQITYMYNFFSKMNPPYL